jgi:hypothetical protein
MVTEDPANSALLMDRGLPIGNSEDVFLRRAAHVKIGNKPSEAIPVTMYEVSGDEVLRFAENLTSPGAPVTIFSEAVPAGKTWYLSEFCVGCPTDARFDVLVDSDVVLRLRTGPASKTTPYTFSPKQPILEGAVISVVCTVPSYAPQSSCETTFQAVEKTA